MKIGDLVLLNKIRFPHLEGKTGLIMSVSRLLPGRWSIMIDGKVLPHYVHTEDIQVVHTDDTVEPT